MTTLQPDRPRALAGAFLAFVLWSSPLAAQSIVTVAGGGFDDNRPASQSSLLGPWGVAVDGAGNVYLADADQRIRKIDAATGLQTTIAGTGISGFSGDGGPATAATFRSPRGLAVDKDGNVYVADRDNNRVRRIDGRTGVVTTVAGSAYGFGGDGGPATRALLASPSAVAVDPSGALLIADANNDRIRAVNLSTGVIGTIAGTGNRDFSGDGGPATRADLAYPYGIALTPSGDLLVADDHNSRVRLVERANGRIRTIAGSENVGFSGDGGPATAAALYNVTAVAADAAGNVYLADYYNQRIRRVAASTGVITTIAGNGLYGFTGDGGPATASSMAFVEALAVAPDGALLYADRQGHRIRRVDSKNGTVSTVSGGGGFGDGGPATSTRLHGIWGVASNAAGTLFLADTYNDRIRRVDPKTGVITTIAGIGKSQSSGDGGPATQAGLWFPTGLALDRNGNLYVCESLASKVRKIDAATGRITTVAGSGQYGSTGDGGPATQATLKFPVDVAVDEDGNVFIADSTGNKIRRVDGRTGVITTLAGTGDPGYDGDGGPATQAYLDSPSGVAVDWLGDVVISDTYNNVIRYVDSFTGEIDTIAGTGDGAGYGDGDLAWLAAFWRPRTLRIDDDLNIFVADWYNHRVRRIDGSTGIVSAAAGLGIPGFSGDEGPATLAEMNVPISLAVSPGGDLFAADTGNGRVRAVYACGPVSPPSLLVPANGASVGTSTPISWTRVEGAFRYDFYLGPAPNALELIAGDIVWTTGQLSGLAPGATYYWAVVAKGDPFCEPQSTARSEIRMLTTSAGCTAPATPLLASPADGAADVAASATLSWQAAAGAGTYDVYLGTSVPPALLQQGVTGTSLPVSGLAPGATYSWSVLARASCDATKATASAVRSFRIAGGCAAPGPFSLSAPAAGATVPSSTTLSWSASANAATYDVYLGTSADPPLYRAGATQTSLPLTGLVPGTTYRWKVVARTPCNAGLTATTAVRTFVVATACTVPGAPSITFAPPTGVGVGQTYSVVWSDAAGLDPDGGYVVERSVNASFSPILDTQTVSDTSATFVAAQEGRLYHRVRAVPGCDPAKAGPSSAAQAVDVLAATPNVVFTVQPRGVVTSLGEPLEGVTDVGFTLENLTSAPVTVSIGRSEIKSPPFFQIVDPLGGDPSLLVLEPRKPRSFGIRFSGPAADKAGTYQGLVSVAGQGLAVLPYAFVSLKVGGVATAAPQLLFRGAESEYASFSPWKDGQPESQRPPLEVQVRNPGTTPMELTGEVGPEVWLVPEAGWNATAIAPGETRTVVLRTNRLYSPKGSRLPRYTYFKVRTRSGQTARLLVQDNDATSTAAGRVVDPDPRGRGSILLPSVVSGRRASGEVTFVTRLRLSNASTAPLQLSLIFTPSGFDGLDASAVRAVTIVVPPNDVLSLTDPLVQVFGLTPTVFGTLEVRTDPTQAGFLTVTSSVDAPAASGGGTYGFQMPAVKRGEGARLDSPHVLSGLATSAAFRTNLIMAETTGIDAASVRLTLYDTDGNALGDRVENVPRFGQVQVNGVVDALGGKPGLLAGRLEITVESGGGSVVGVVTVIDNTTADAVAYLSRPMNPSSGSAVRKLLRKALGAEAETTAQLLVPSVVNGYPAFPDGSAPGTFQSQLIFTSGNLQPATFELEYVDETSGARVTKSVTAPPRGAKIYENVLEELFGYPAGARTFGTLWVKASLNGIVQSKVYSKLEKGTLGDAFPVVPIPSEEMTGKSLEKPIMIDGLEQAVELAGGSFSERVRGTRSNLILNEVSGSEVTVEVSLYEAANRTSPLSTKRITLGPRQRAQLNTVFADLDLGADERRKDRTNVLCVVRHVSGGGLVAGVVTTVDNKTADIKTAKLTPSGGVPGTTSGIGAGR